MLKPAWLDTRIPEHATAGDVLIGDDQLDQTCFVLHTICIMSSILCCVMLIALSPEDSVVRSEKGTAAATNRSCGVRSCSCASKALSFYFYSTVNEYDLSHELLFHINRVILSKADLRLSGHGEPICPNRTWRPIGHSNPTSILSILLVGFTLDCFNIQPQGNRDPTFALCFCMKTPHSKVHAWYEKTQISVGKQATTWR